MGSDRPVCRRMLLLLLLLPLLPMLALLLLWLLLLLLLAVRRVRYGPPRPRRVSGAALWRRFARCSVRASSWQ